MNTLIELVLNYVVLVTLSKEHFAEMILYRESRVCGFEKWWLKQNWWQATKQNWEWKQGSFPSPLICILLFTCNLSEAKKKNIALRIISQKPKIEPLKEVVFFFEEIFHCLWMIASENFHFRNWEINYCTFCNNCMWNIAVVRTCANVLVPHRINRINVEF